MNSLLLESTDTNLNESQFSRLSLLTGTNYSQDFEILEEMGYNSTMIKKVYAFLKPNSIEQAINYMTEENGIYHHNFFKDYKHKKKTCYICGKSKENHINSIIEENEDDETPYDNENNKLIDNLTDVFTCDICGEKFNKNSKNIIKNEKCNDEYCRDCWFSYLRNKIEEGYVNKIKCMNYNCKEILNDKFIRSIIQDNKILIDKYEKFSLRSEILNNPNKKFCPIQGCESYAEKKGKNKYVECKNKHKFCFNCLKNWHGKVKCEKKEEEDFKIWKKDKIIKQCPNCKMWTEKNEGCNHMTCVECKFQWCWLCGGKYQSNHFSQGKCNGLQFYKPKSEEDIKKVLNNMKRDFNLNWSEPEGLIPFSYFNRNGSIDPNNPLRNFNELNFFLKIAYFFQYIFLGFEFISYRFFKRVKYRNCETKFYYNYIYYGTLISFIPIFFIPMACVMIIPLIPGIFYFPYFKKVWIYYWLIVVKNVGYFLDE